MLLAIVVAANLGLGPDVFTFLARVPGGDKTGHFLLLGGLSFLVNMTLSAKTVRLGPVSVLKGSLVVGVLATAEELSQLLLKSRTFDPGDLLCDYLGIVCFAWLARRLVRTRRLRPDPIATG